MHRLFALVLTLSFLAFMAGPAAAVPFSFSTGNVTNSIATASRPDSPGKFEIEAADDFVTTAPTTFITGASFTGLLFSPTGLSIPLNNIGQVAVEIYRVFPNDSDTTRTPNVPTRANSPSDVAFATRDSSAGGLSFTPAIISASSTALNSVKPGGIHPSPGQTTGGDGPVAGELVTFNVDFKTTPFSLPAGHYFFIPQVEVTTADGDFLWLSGTRPIVAPGTPFPPGFTDLQSWTRDANLDPDWLRVGTDIVGAGTFNAAFTLSGDAVPLPASLPLLGTGLAGLLLWRCRKPSA